MEKSEKEKKIKTEIAALSKAFSEIEKEKRTFTDRLIQQCAFMVVTLAELQESLNEGGAVELFVNGRQEMLREHPAAKTYNTMIKNYNGIIKQLIDLVPESKNKEGKLKALMNDE